MLQSLIFIIPTFFALGFAAFKAKTEVEKYSMFIMIVSVIFLWFYFFVMGWEWFGTKPIPEWVSQLHNISACLTLPFAFMAVTAGIGKKLVSFSTMTLFLLCGILFIHYGALSLDHVPAIEPFDTENITFLYDGNVIGRFRNFSIVMLFQAIWMICRATIMAKGMKKDGLHGSHQAVAIVVFLFAILSFIIITICIPTFFWQFIPARYIHFIIISALFTGLFIAIGLDFGSHPILDENNEPVYFDRKPRLDDMAKKCLQLYDEDKIYLTPSLKLEDLAKMLGTNRTYAAELMKDHFGSTFAAYTNARRVEEAKKIILANPNEKMEVIAGMCGFATAPTFTKVFKAAMEKTPSAWLAEQLKGGSNETTEEETVG